MKRFSSGCLTVESLRSKSDSPFLSTVSCLFVARIQRTTSTLSNVEKKTAYKLTYIMQFLWDRTDVHKS